jgi:hypothetical protein
MLFNTYQIKKYVGSKARNGKEVKAELLAGKDVYCITRSRDVAMSRRDLIPGDLVEIYVNNGFVTAFEWSEEMGGN